MRATRYKLFPHHSARYRDIGSSDYLQWWYFDAEFENGYHMMAIMLPRTFGRIEDDLNGPDPGITLTITDPDYRNHHSRDFYPGEFTGDPERMLVTFGKNRMEYHEGRYRLLIHQKGIGCELEFIPRLPPWPPMPGRGGYMTSPLVWFNHMAWSRGKYFHYASLVPRGSVKGKISLPGGEVKVEGRGYHEQGRTNTVFQNMFTYWYWTRFYLGDWTFIFPVAESPRRTLHAKMRALLIYYKEEPVADIFDVSGVFLKHRVHSYRNHPGSGRSIPQELTFLARWPGLRLKVEMDLFHERECFRYQPFTGTAPLQPVWSQHLMRVKVDMRWKGRSIELEGQGVFETMLTSAC